MIVLKAGQNQLLALTDWVESVGERRFAPYGVNKVNIHKTINKPAMTKPSAKNVHLVAGLKAAHNRALSAVPRPIGFFSAAKANLRNAP
jgi:hypothetical protein